jgi:predicted membrane GTPase involved in stress response
VRPFCLVRRATLEEAIASLQEDERVEATPRTIRLRKTPELPQAADE